MSNAASTAVSAPVSRRAFATGAGLATAAVAAGAGALMQVRDACADEPWDREVDVVVVGSGGSGLSAAIEAAAAGVDTLVLEKGGIAGGTTIRSAGITQAAGTSFQKEFTEYQDDTPENHFNWYMALGEGQVDEELVRDLAYGCPEVIRWYTEDLGLTIYGLSGQSHVPYADEYYAVRIHRPDGEGPALIGAMEKAAQENGAAIECDSEVVSLVTDADGAVTGVVVEGPNGTERIGARGGVVLATSNVDHNIDMAKRFCPQQVWAMGLAECLSAPTNTGDGIRMAMQVGADLAAVGGGMDAILDLKLTSGQPIWGLIFVNKAGVRYVCEDAHYAYKTRMQYQMERSTGHPCYAVWAQSNLENCRPWDAETIKEAVESGIVIEADSLEELAEKIGVDTDGLRNTVDFWNEVTVPAGEDPQFGRISGFERIEGEKYYANRMRPEIMGPVGGLRIDVETHVLHPDGSVIPGLYAAGLCTGGWVGPFYPGSGTAMAANAHFGRKAGRNAAARA